MWEKEIHKMLPEKHQKGKLFAKLDAFVKVTYKCT
jgi:hypothetical protein